jgi:hypothetical protein
MDNGITRIAAAAAVAIKITLTLIIKLYSS